MVPKEKESSFLLIRLIVFAKCKSVIGCRTWLTPYLSLSRPWLSISLSPSLPSSLSPLGPLKPKWRRLFSFCCDVINISGSTFCMLCYTGSYTDSAGFFFILDTEKNSVNEIYVSMSSSFLIEMLALKPCVEKHCAWWEFLLWLVSCFHQRHRSNRHGTNRMVTAHSLPAVYMFEPQLCLHTAKGVCLDFAKYCCFESLDGCQKN